MCFKKKIGQVMKTLNFMIKQLPQPRQVEHLKKIKSIGQKYPQQDETSLKNVLKELQFRVKFLKVSYPDKIFDVPEEQQEPDVKNEIIDQVNKQYKTLEETQKAKKFVMKDGKLVQGEAQVRKEVDFSNWAAGNIDPQAMKKHRQLLDRQHFIGPAWQNKELPQLTAAQFLQASNLAEQDIEYSLKTEDNKPKKPVKQRSQQAFESVKR